MGILSREVRAVQNPGLGAGALWSFCDEFYHQNQIHQGPPLQFLFIVLPLILQEEFRQHLLSTQKGSGLRMFIEKLSMAKTAMSDLVLAIQARMKTLSPLTLESTRMMLATGMANIDWKDGRVVPRTVRGLDKDMPEEIKRLLRASRRLGHWTSNLSVYEVSIILRVRF